MDTATAVGLGTGSIRGAGRVTRDLMDAAKGETQPRRGGLNSDALATIGIKVVKSDA